MAIFGPAGYPNPRSKTAATTGDWAEAARQWTVNFNPRPLTADDFVALYTAANIPRGNGDAVK